MNSNKEKSKTNGSKGKIKPWMIAILVVVIALVVCAGVAIARAHIVVNGEDIKYSKDMDITKELEEKLYEDGYVFTDGKMEQACVTYSIDTSQVESNASLLAGILHREYTIDIQTTVDKQALAAYVDEWNESAQESVNAKVDEDDQITEEVYGNKIDKKDLLKAVTTDAKGINPEDYYVQPTVTKEDMEAAVAEKKEYQAWKATYENGFEITIPEDCITITKKAKVKVDTSFLEDSVDQLDDTYNTIGDPVSFKTHGGETIELSGGYWGEKVDEITEVNYLKEAISKKESITDRSPQLAGHGGAIGNTYAEVSISAQHVWIYQDGKVTMESDFVSGKAGEHDTPKGAYYLLERKTDKTLVGEDYETKVKYWMRITWTGVGFHDASWRSSFGGSIYKKSGSHGCINLPASFAARLFDIAYVGMPVIIY